MNQDGDAIREIIEEVAVKHGVALDRDDPVLMIYTINQRVMQASVGIHQALLEQYRNEMETNIGAWKTLATRQGDKVLQTAMDATREVIAATVRRETEAALDELMMDLQKHHRSASLNILASVLALAASAIVLWAALL